MARKSTPEEMNQKATDLKPPKKQNAETEQKGKAKDLAEQIEERAQKAPQKKKSLREQIEEREERAAETAPSRKPVVTQIARRDERNDKRSKTLSLRVYTDIHDAFTKINRRRGMSTNSVLNMLITQYIRDNRDILEEN